MSGAGSAARGGMEQRLWTIPNQITLARLVLAVLLFAILEYDFYLAGLMLFALASGTDWVDGFLARRWGQVTVVGRMLDPFVDKIIICGTFIFLAARPASGIAAWMATVIVARELLVTAMRSYMESRGVDFSASWAGKWKMAAQCVAAAWCLFVLYFGDSTPWGLRVGRDAAVWAAIALTVYSGAEYVAVAARKSPASAGQPPG